MTGQQLIKENLLESFPERLNQALSSAGIKPVELARRSGVDAAYLSLLRSGKRRNPSISVIDSLATALAISPAWLKSGRGEMNIPVARGIEQSRIAESPQEVERPMYRRPAFPPASPVGGGIAAAAARLDEDALFHMMQESLDSLKKEGAAVRRFEKISTLRALLDDLVRRLDGA